MRESDIILCKQLNSPALVCELVSGRGTFQGNWFEGFHVDILSVWAAFRRPVRKHPLIWLNSYKGQDLIKGFQTLYPEGSENEEGTPIFLSHTHEDSEIQSLLDDPPAFDPAHSLMMNPFIVYKYMRHVSKDANATFVGCDPSNSFTYKGFTFRGSSHPLYPLWDVIGGIISDPNPNANPLANDIRQIHASWGSWAVTLDDVWHYGKEELDFLGITHVPDFVGAAQVPAFLGLRRKPSALSEDETNLRFETMKTARQRMVRTRRGNNAYLLVTKEKVKYIVDQLLGLGYLQPNY